MSSLADYFTNQVPVISFVRLYERCVREMGLDSASWNATGSLGEKICDFMTDRLRKAYERDWWPVLTPVVERDVVDSSGKYVPWVINHQVVGLSVGANVYLTEDNLTNGRKKYTKDADNYIEWSTDNSRWEFTALGSLYCYGVEDVATPDLVETWQIDDVIGEGTTEVPLPLENVYNEFYEPMDAIRRVTPVNPELMDEDPEEIPYKLSPRGLDLSKGGGVVGEMVWVEFKLRPPVVTRVAWDEEETYAMDDVVYDESSKDCYRSLRDANLNHGVGDELWWERQRIPAMFTRYVAKGVYADWLRTHGDGQQTADRESGRASAELDRLSEVHRPMQRQHESVDVQAHP